MPTTAPTIHQPPSHRRHQPRRCRGHARPRTSPRRCMRGHAGASARPARSVRAPRRTNHRARTDAMSATTRTRPTTPTCVAVVMNGRRAVTMTPSMMMRRRSINDDDAVVAMCVCVRIVAESTVNCNRRLLSGGAPMRIDDRCEPTTCDASWLVMIVATEDVLLAFRGLGYSGDLAVTAS